MNRQVWIFAEQTRGELLSEMTYGSLIKYSVDGIEFEEIMEEGDYEILTDWGVVDE